MKRFILNICVCFICFVSIIATSACSCSKTIQTYAEVGVSEIDSKQFFDFNFEIKLIVEQKYREPANTACYEKVEDEFVLIKDASYISDCYDAEGNYFEKANHKLAEKKVLSEEVIFDLETQDIGDVENYISQKNEIPEEEKQSLIYRVIVENKDKWFNGIGNNSFYVKELKAEDILNGLIKESSLDKVQFTMPEATESIDGESYIYVKANSSIEFIVELKGLTEDDLELSKGTDLKLNFDLNLRKSTDNVE